MTKSTDLKNFATRRIVVGILAAVIVLWLIGMTISFIKNPPTKDVAQEQKMVHQPEQPSPAPVVKETHKPQETQRPTEAKPTDEAVAVHEVEAQPLGVAFVDATMAPLQHELNERFWGWRPNDILNFTDNINNFQLGVLEVTRRTAMVLSDSISRTGSTAALDPDIENAITWFMIGAGKYWFPSAESKYRAGIKELETYKAKLIRREANFYTRADNLIPLLVSFQNLLGSCDENLVKTKEENGNKVSTFKADDHLYYARGVANSMATILEAVEKDFHKTIVARNGEESLHHAIASCRKATKIKPWLVLESDLSGMLANHRANMATSIIHARFYLDVLIRTLST